MKRTNRPFTLIEILTVIVVISVIVGIAVPAYNRLMTGNAVSYGNRLVTSQLNMARTHACARRRPVAVLFPDCTLSTDYSVELKDPVALRTFRCAYVKQDGTDWIFDGWVEGTKWEYLPQGAFFPTIDANQPEAKDDTDGLVSSLKAPDILKGVYDGTVDPEVESQSSDDAKKLLFSGKHDFKLAIIFQKNGRPVNSGKSPRVQVREGVLTDNVDNAALVTKFNVDNKLVAKVNRYTGAVTTKE